MAVIAVSKPQEDFIVQINGEYGMVFDEVVAPYDVVSGQVSTFADALTGIYAHTAKKGEHVRCMVRGNPTTVNYQALVGDPDEWPLATLKEAGIIIVNQ